MDIDIRFVARGYFDVLGRPIEQGRAFARLDDPDSAVINERAARELWPWQSAVGRRFIGATTD